ncbi:hypothetical protein [Ralstonia phage RSF1]|uniref:Uncharacterized protein n=1 Tax=Ralstonia phage RSF1 TaxID=1689679 RepID=A0A0K2QQG0_9CAUD|nr:hypothetical protein AVU11_gp033 [Ralstonia phage RSF1]BAS04825.2 hypothetical protein [Ralstonia phage RSF1]
MCFQLQLYNQIFFGKNSFSENIMQNTNGYLIKRIKQVLRTDELNPKDLSLDMLMTAYASVHDEGASGSDDRITMKVPALATYYARLLDEGKFVVINDPFENRWYFVKAHEQDLIAVYYAIGPWLNFYGIKATSEHTLRELNINQAVIADFRILDRIFNFRPWNPEAEDDKEPATMVIEESQPGARWLWHTGHKPAGKKEKTGQPHDTLDPLEGRTENVSAPAHIVEAAGAPEGSQVAELGENQMQRAFRASGQNRREERRDQRRHHDQQQHKQHS